MPLVEVNDESIRQAAQIIARGGLVAFPTETVYGLGADAYNPESVAKIFEVKNRPSFDPLIVHIASAKMLEKITDIFLLDSKARGILGVLIKNFWPGPLTLILPKQQTIPDIVTAGLSSVAVRFPGHEAARKLIALSSGAIAAPSANLFGRLSPTRARHVFDMLGDKVDMILDGGPSDVGVESTVLNLCDGPPGILRPGGVPVEAIESLIGPVVFGAAFGVAENVFGSEAGLTSPGMLKSHYAPRIPLTVYNNPGDMPNEPDSAVIFFDGPSRDIWLLTAGNQPKAAILSVLSETGNMFEAAAKFFETLHNADKPGISRIYAQLAGETGLGAAINDRLRKGSGG